MTRYILRLDDASPFCNLKNWDRMEELLDRYGIAPIAGIIPDNKDTSLLTYPYDADFWRRVQRWQNKGWCIALHGYDHVYRSPSGGINPVNRRSEFAGLTLREQEAKIKKGIAVLSRHGLNPKVFFAPAHTFDHNTLKALKNKSKIRIISDTVANDIYFKHDFYFIPQQAGAVRRLPLKIVTFCYHPNGMNEADFARLEQFINRHQSRFVGFDDLKMTRRSKSLYDGLLSLVYLNLRGLLR